MIPALGWGVRPCCTRACSCGAASITSVTLACSHCLNLAYSFLRHSGLSISRPLKPTPKTLYRVFVTLGEGGQSASGRPRLVDGRSQLPGAVVLTDRPIIIARDEQGRLHGEHGPALAWADGSTLPAIRGVRAPAHVVQAPETITVDQIRGEQDVEVRRVLLDRYGPARFVRDADAERVHTDRN